MNTNPSLPSLILVGSQAFADQLSTCGAHWYVYPAVPTVNAMWDGFENGSLPTDATVVIITDGTGEAVDDVEGALAAVAPWSETFLVATSSRGPAILTRAKELAANIEGGDPNANLTLLPAENLAQTLLVLYTTLMGRVAWGAADEAPVEAQPAYAPAPTSAPIRAPQPDIASDPYFGYDTPAPGYAPPAPTPVAAPAYYEAPQVTEPEAPTESPTLRQVDYEQGGYYASNVIETAREVLPLPENARPNQLTISVMSPKGGAGKSTTAIALAGAIAKCSAAAGHPLRVVLVDLDTRDGQLGSLIGKYTPTSLNIRLAPAVNAQTVTRHLIPDKFLGIDTLVAPVNPTNAADVGPEFYRKVIQVLKTTHDVVILDCSVSYMDKLLGVGFALSDQILLVTTVATTSVQGMARALTWMFNKREKEGLGIDRNKVGIVANGVVNGVGMSPDTILKAALGAPLLAAIPDEKIAVLKATNEARMHKLLTHPTLGPAYFKLAKRCIGTRFGVELAPIVAAAPTASVQQDEAVTKKKRGLFGGKEGGGDR